MSLRPSFAVVIPMYNKQRFISRTLRSVLAQTVAPSEIIVIDDGSTDRSLKVAEDILAPISSARIVRQANQGVSAARNAGARLSSADFIAFLDADDEWFPGHLAVLRDLAVDFPDAEVVLARHCRELDGHRIKQILGLPPGVRGIVDDFVNTYRLGSGLVHSSAVAIRPRAFAACGGFPVGATRGEDIYLWLRLGLGRQIAFDDTTTVMWHDDGSDAENRSAVLPYHLERFLDPATEPNYWTVPELKRYLRKSLIINILSAAHQQQASLVRRLLHLSRRLEVWFFASAFIVASIPKPVLRLGRRTQLYRRREKMSVTKKES